MSKIIKFHEQEKKALKLAEGEICSVCSAHLEPGERVYLKEDDTMLMTMPKNGKPAGVPVICANCK